MKSYSFMENDIIINRFKRLIANKRLAHAYLLAGPSNTPKLETALSIAELVNETNDARISAGTHPDIHILGNNDEDSIKIDEIRYVLGRVVLRAFEAKVKVFVIVEAQRMTQEAANALLKTLEEPTPNTLIILTTSVIEACLDTIKSRCQIVKFFSLDESLPEGGDRIVDAFLSRINNDDFLKNLSSDKDKVTSAMLVLLGFLRDSLLVKNGISAQGLLFKNRLADLNKMAHRSIQELDAIQQQIIRVKTLTDQNLNVRMALSLVKERICQN